MVDRAHAEAPGLTTLVMNERDSTPSPDAVGAQLVVMAGRNAGHRLPIHNKLTVGRAKTADLQLDDDGLSRQHFRIQLEGETYIIEDLQSRNGTYLNGDRIARATIHFGDRISVGAGTIMVFSRRDALEERILQSQKLQILGELSSGIAHDFNNLLSALLASTEYLVTNAELEDPRLRGCVRDIAMSARRAMELSNQLLGFARSSSQTHITTDYSQLVRDACKLVRRVLPQTVEIQTSIIPDLHVTGDPTQLLQVLMNLCVNAADAMPSGGLLRIDLRPATAAEMAEDGDAPPVEHVALVVSDTGTGMDAGTQKRVLEPFFTTKDRGKGTGLGLATADRVIRSHAGRMRIDSAPAQGSRFSIFFPRAATSDTRDSRQTPMPDADLTGKSILLVEDEEVVRSSLSRVLERAGVKVTEAADGLTAMALARDANHAFDLVILDLDLPRASGEQVLGVIQSAESPPAVLVSSGYLDETRMETLRAAGIDAFLHKPYGSRELLRQITETLAGRDQPSSSS